MDKLKIDKVKERKNKRITYRENKVIKRLIKKIKGKLIITPSKKVLRTIDYFLFMNYFLFSTSLKYIKCLILEYELLSSRAKIMNTIDGCQSNTKYN